MATSNFPSSLDTTSALPASISDTANLNSPNHADMHEVTNDAIIEIEEKLGTGDTTASTGAVLIGTGSGASAWDTSPTFVGAVTVGEDDTGYDVTFHGDTAGHKAHWDTSANALAISGSASMLRLVDLDSDSAPYIGFYDSSYNASEVTGRLGYVGYPNNDDLYVRNDNAGGITFIKSASTIKLEATSGVEVGSNGSGHDVVFYSGTAGDNLTWDASEECLIITGTAGQLALDVAAGTVEFNGNFNVGEDGSGHDVRFYSATVGESFHWDASDEILKINGIHGQDALSVLDGNVYIADTLDVDGSCLLDGLTLDGNMAFTGTLSGTSSIPRMAYTHASSTKATVASHQLDSNPSILICDTQPTASLNDGDIWFDIS